MIDKSQLRRLEIQCTGLHGFNVEAFARAVWFHGRDAGLEEAVAACHNEGLTDSPTNGEDEAYMLAIEHCVAAIKAIKENKHDR